jgi:hypothetical protein
MSASHLTAGQRLALLAENEAVICELHTAREWPGVVTHAYHVGRRAAFAEAAAIVDSPAAAASTALTLVVPSPAGPRSTEHLPPPQSPKG